MAIKHKILEVQNIKLPIYAETATPNVKTQCDLYGHDFVGEWGEKKFTFYRCIVCGFKVKLVAGEHVMQWESEHGKKT
jgi:hypothetical protein